MVGSNERVERMRRIIGGAMGAMGRMGAMGPMGVIGAMALVVGAAGCEGESLCAVDEDCGGGDVCARSNECLPESQVRRVQVRWTIGGEAATEATCARVDPLRIDFFSDRPGDELSYEPLACTAGLFTLDKMPSRMTRVQIGGPRIIAHRSGFPSDGQVMINLQPPIVAGAQ